MVSLDPAHSAADAAPIEAWLETSTAAAGEAGRQLIAELYFRYWRPVYQTVLAIVREPEATRDISQETFLQAWRQLGRFDPGRAPVQSWLVSIARSRAIDFLRTARAKKRRPAHDGTDPEACERADELLVRDERRRMVRGALQQLRPDERRVFELAYYGGFCHREIAEQLGMPLGTVKTRLRRGLLRLRRLLSPSLSGRSSPAGRATNGRANRNTAALLLQPDKSESPRSAAPYRRLERSTTTH